MRGHLLLWAAGGALLLTGYLALADGLHDFGNHALFRDFAAHWLAGRCALTGDAAGVYDAARYWEALRVQFHADIPQHFWPYPPHALLICAPVAALPYLPAYLVWMGVSLVTFLLAARGMVPQWRWLAFAPAAAVNLLLGQNGFLTAALFLWGMTARRAWWAGLALALLTMKPQLGLLIPVALLAEKNWRVIGWTVGLTAAVLLLTTLLFGSAVWPAWLAGLRVHEGLVATGSGLFLWFMASAFGAARVLGLSATTGLLWHLPLLLVASAAVWRAYRAGAPQRLAVLIAATLLATPHLYAYDLNLLSVALLLLPAATTRGTVLLRSVLWGVPLLLIPCNAAGLPVAPLLLALLLRLAWRAAMPGAPR